jgi:hypothetical protein
MMALPGLKSEQYSPSAQSETPKDTTPRTLYDAGVPFVCHTGEPLCMVDVIASEFNLTLMIKW